MNKKEPVCKLDKLGYKNIFFRKIKTVLPFLSGFTEAETPQVTPSKLPHGTRKNPLSAAAFLP